jgi:hypothetical protein
MADLTSDDLNKMIDALNANTRAHLKGSSATDKNTKASEKSAKSSGGSSKSGDAKVIQDLIGQNKALGGVVGSLQKKMKSLDTGLTSSLNGFKKLSSSAGSASTAISALGAAFGAGGVMAAMVSALSDATKTYQDLSQIGQTFGGSMLEMQKAAAASNMSLTTFANALKQNSTVVASIGANAFGEMSKSLRNSLMDVGQLGLTSEQLNTQLGTYLETQRLYGNLSNQTTEKTTANMKSLSIETAKAAQMTGMSTEAISKMAAGALRDETLRARLLQMNSDGQNNYGLAMNKAIIYMSALPGEAGKTLSTMLAQTAGRGSAIMSDASNTFIEAGLFGVTNLMDDMAQKVANNTWNDQDAADFNRKFVAEGMKNMATLQFQAASGNKAAASAINMISEMQELAKKSPEELAQTKNITKFLENLGVIIDKVSGALRTGFYNGLENLMKGFEKFADDPAFDEFIKKIQGMAEKFGKFLSDNITPEKLIAFGEALANGVAGLVSFGSKVLTVVEYLGEKFGWLTDKIGFFGAALVTWAAWQTAKMAGGAVASYGGRVKDLLGEKFGIGGKKEGAPLTQNNIQNAFEHALAKFSNGTALRVVDLNNSGKGNDFDFDHDKNEKGKKGKKGRRTRRTGRASSARKIMDAASHANHAVPHELPHPSAPHVPHVTEAPKASRMYRMGHAAGDMTRRAATSTSSFAGRAITSTRSGLSRGWAATKSGASKAVGAVRRVPGRMMGSRVAGGLMRGGTSVVKGAGSLVRGIGMGGVGAIAGMGASMLLDAAPDFKGKETLQAVAQFAGMGAMLGPIGAAVGAGIGVIYANWDDLTGMVTGAFSAVKNFDYAGAFSKVTGMLGSIGSAFGAGVDYLGSKWTQLSGFASDAFGAVKDFDYSGALSKAGAMLGPISTVFGGGVLAIFNNWDSISGVVSNGINAIKDFDYAGAFNKASDALGPIGAGVKWYVGAVWSSWKKIGGWLKSGWSSIKNGITGAWKSLMGGNDAALDSMNQAVQPPKTDLAAPITQKFDEYTKNVNTSFTDLNTASQTALANVSTPVDLMANQNVDMFNAAKMSTASYAGPSKPDALSVPEINTDALVAQQSEWKVQALQLQKDNLETKGAMMQLMDNLNQGTQQQVGGMRDLIGEQQKSNRNLETVAGNII